MAIYLKKNSKPDPWYSLHGESIPVGEVLKLVNLTDHKTSSAMYPATVIVRRSKTTGDSFHYDMSLNCLDYLGSSL